MDHGGGLPYPHLQIDEEIDRGHYNGTCSIDEFVNYYTAKSEDEVSKPSWESGDNGLTIFWHQKEDESQSQSESKPNYTRRSQTHEPNKETLQHKIISVLSSLSLPKDDVFLIQLWAPTKIRGRMVLTTCGQPFGFSYIINSQEEEEGPPEQPHYSFRKGICRYRKICLGLQYDVVDHFDNTTNNVGIVCSNSSSSQQQQQVLQLGPPARVFKQGLPELSLYIGYFTNQEFPLGGYAKNECGFFDYFALPLFESTGRHHCLGVLEILTNNFLLLQYAVAACFFRTLERAHLRLQPPHLHECSKIGKDVLASRVDIKEVLKFVREMYQLPLVQTWFPCMCGEGDPEKYVGYHAKTTNLFCEMLNYDSNKEYFAMYMDCCHKYGGFSIREGKGLVGRAYSFKKAYFCRDASQFTLSDYPIVHCTRAAELTACFAIPLHFLDPSLYAFVLEIFLPRGQLQNYSSDAVLVALLKLLLSTMINAFSRLNGSLGLQQGEEFSVELVPSSDDDDDNFKFFDICRSGGNLNRHNEALENARAELQVQSPQPPPIIGGSNVTNNDKTKANNVRKKQHSSIAARSKRRDITGNSRPEKYASARARITLDVLKPYSEGTLEDAALSLGVGRSTLKRICRELGIEDWRQWRSLTRRTKVDHHIHSNDPRLPAAGAVESVEEDVIHESGEGNPGIINALVEREAAAPIIPTSATGGEIGDKSAVMIVKATYKGKNVRFPLSCNSGIKHLRQKIAKRFELQVKSFTIEYEDEVGVLTMIPCDEDLHDHIESLKSSGQNIIKFLVVPKIIEAG